MNVANLEDVVVVLDEYKQVDKTVTASGGKLKVKKRRARNSANDSGPVFDVPQNVGPISNPTVRTNRSVIRLRTLFGDRLVNLAVKNEPPNDAPDDQRFNLSAVLEYYDLFENLVVRDSLRVDGLSNSFPNRIRSSGRKCVASMTNHSLPSLSNYLLRLIQFSPPSTRRYLSGNPPFRVDFRETR